MEIIDFKVFKAIIEEGSITRAAEKLDYVQSNITTRVRKLESELGTQLLYRNPKGVVPTEKGLLFHKYSTDILRNVDEMTKAIKGADYPSGQLEIGVVETMASSGPFISALSEYQYKYPEVALSLVTGTSPQNYEKVLNYQLDGAFISGEFDLSPLYVAHEIREEVVLISAAGAELDHSNAAWVVFPKGCPLRSASEDWLRSEGLPPANMIEVSTLETMLSCVRAGIGYTLMTASAVPVGDNQIQVHTVPERYRFITTRLVTRKDQFHSKAFTAFADGITTAGF